MIELCASNQNIWYKNQNVNINYNQNKYSYSVASLQTCSTPGIITTLLLKENTSYKITVHGQTNQNTKSFVWVNDLLLNKRIIPNYTFLSKSPNCTVDTIFCTPSSNNTHVKIGIGVLITAPQCGSHFLLNKIVLQELNQTYSKQNKTNKNGTDYSSSNSSSSSDSDSDSDSDDDATYRSETSYQQSDPYYQCSPATNVTSSQMNLKPPSTNTVSIQDLQTNLGKMITNLNKFS